MLPDEFTQLLSLMRLMYFGRAGPGCSLLPASARPCLLNIMGRKMEPVAAGRNFPAHHEVRNSISVPLYHPPPSLTVSAPVAPSVPLPSFGLLPPPLHVLFHAAALLKRYTPPLLCPPLSIHPPSFSRPNLILSPTRCSSMPSSSSPSLAWHRRLTVYRSLAVTPSLV